MHTFAAECIARALASASALAPGRPAWQLSGEEAAAAVRSERLLRQAGEAIDGFAPLSRFFPARDGWVRTHANYPWHRAALLRALGTDEAGVPGAIAALGAAEVEARAYRAGGLATQVRTAAQWRAEAWRRPAAPPLFALRRTGRAAPRTPRETPDAAQPLAGVRVLDFTRVIAGPVATRYLGALGADVLRIDAPAHPELELHRLDGLLAKRSALLDLDDEAALAELLDGADVVVVGARPGALARFGLTAEALAANHPGLVHVRLSAWGASRGWEDRRGFDSLVQAATGIAAAHAQRDGTPGALPCQVLDHATGYLAAALACELLAKQRAGGGSWAGSVALETVAARVLAHPDPAGSEPRQAPMLRLGELDVVAPPGTIGGERLRWAAPPGDYGAADPAWN